MKHVPGWLRATTILSALAVSATASATTGYFALGYGAKGMGMVGAVVSNPQDSAVIAVNPAGLTEIGTRLDLGMRFFSPIREAELNTSVVSGTFDVDDKSRRNLFLIPNIGFNMKIGDNLWFGFNNYGNGGLNSTYDRNLYDEAFAVLGAAQFGIPDPIDPINNPPLCVPGPGVNCAALVPLGAGTGTPDTGKLGVDLVQAIYAPSLATKLRDKHSVGVALLIGVQRFSARGLGNFQCFTQTGASDPAMTCQNTGGAFTMTPSDGLTNNNSDWAFGAGARIGWLGDVHPRLTLGASYSSKIYMTEFDDYDELFAEQGDLDIPANFTLGATFKATPKLKLSFDFQQIQYEGVNSISNPGPVFNPDIGGSGVAGPDLPCGTGNPACLLGADNGMGFGWEDINIYRLAAEYDYNSQWTIRGGFAMNDQPIPDSQVLFNILAPATIEKHVTAGFTFRPDKTSEWNFAYMHAFEETVSTPLSAFGVPASIEMYQHSVDLSYSKKF
jgi:long-chain fatty acid transport protein